jgi:hypothetical protein
VPKKILDLMKVDGLTRENVASHLQKYRLYLKRVQQNAPGQGGGAAATGGSAAAAAGAGSSSFSAAMGLPSMLAGGHNHNQMLWDGSKQLMDVMHVQQQAAAASVQQAAAAAQQQGLQQHQPQQQQQQHPGQQQQQQMPGMLGMMPGGGLMSPMGQVMPGLNMGMGAMTGGLVILGHVQQSRVVLIQPFVINRQGSRLILLFLLADGLLVQRHGPRPVSQMPNHPIKQSSTPEASHCNKCCITPLLLQGYLAWVPWLVWVQQQQLLAA